MALETWLLRKVKTALSHSLDAVKSAAPHPCPAKRSNVGVLSFEIAALMSKLLHLWNSLSDKNLVRLRNDSISVEGVRKIVSNDETFLLSLACSEIIDSLRSATAAISRHCLRCHHGSLRNFDRSVEEFADSGRDIHGWALGSKDMDSVLKKMERYVSATTALHREIDELALLENSLKKSMQISEQKVIDLQQKIVWRRHEVKAMKERSVWNRSFDSVCWILVRSVFTILARIKVVFGIGCSYNYPYTLPRSLSAASVHPGGGGGSGGCGGGGFFEANSKLLKAPPTTLGYAALALHYANLIIVMEKMVKSPQLIGVDARDDLYAMLPQSVRSSLRSRLRGVGFSASDPGLATEWRDAIGRILGWLSPMAHNMIKWQSERSFEQKNPARTNTVFLLQTLHFANKDKTEAAITELLVGLNYIWRFEREMTAKALFECAHLNGYVTAVTYFLVPSWCHINIMLSLSAWRNSHELAQFLDIWGWFITMIFFTGEEEGIC